MSYDRVACRIVSVYALSHWEDESTIRNLFDEVKVLRFPHTTVDVLHFVWHNEVEVRAMLIDSIVQREAVRTETGAEIHS